MPIRRSPNGVLNAVHRLGRLPGTVGLHPVGTVGRHASERQVVMTWCARSYHLPRTELAQYLGHQGQQPGNQQMEGSPDKPTIVRGICHGHFVFQDLITCLSPGKRRAREPHKTSAHT